MVFTFWNNLDHVRALNGCFLNFLIFLNGCLSWFLVHWVKHVETNTFWFNAKGIFSNVHWENLRNVQLVLTYWHNLDRVRALNGHFPIFSIAVWADSLCIELGISWYKFRLPTMYDEETQIFSISPDIIGDRKRYFTIRNMRRSGEWHTLQDIGFKFLL